jgi:ribonuclease HI
MSKRKFYAVAAGRKPGIYDQWFGADGAEAQVKGFADAVYKSFQSRTEAEAWFTQVAGSPPTYVAKTPGPQEQAAPEIDYFTLHRDALAADKIVMYTDGGCIGNPGPGGYGVVLLSKGHRKELSGGFALTTNNRMELMACIAGLRALKRKSAVVIFCDSSYVIDGIQKGWARKWRDNDWKRNEGDELKAVKNADLWMQLLELCEYHEEQFVQVKGHAGSAENERCHQLSTVAMNKAGLPIDVGFDKAPVDKS